MGKGAGATGRGERAIGEGAGPRGGERLSGVELPAASAAAATAPRLLLAWLLGLLPLLPLDLYSTLGTGGATADVAGSCREASGTGNV